jgi:hypothetical protein
MKSKHGAMTVEQLLEIDKKIGRLHENHAPSVVPERSVGDTLARFLARRMAFNPDTDITDAAYIQEYIQSGFTRFSAKRIVVKARMLSQKLKVIAVSDQPTTPQNSLPTPGTIKNQPATPIPECNLTEYVRALPETLPRPIRSIVRPEKRSEVMQINLQRLRNELFLPDTDRFVKQSRYQAPVTSDNPYGMYQLSASNPEKQRYGLIWDAIGNNNIPPLWFPAILPYLAEEGLLEYYKVNIGLVGELEQIRQTYLSDGVLPVYDRNSTFIPMTKPPHAPDSYVYS